MKKSFRILLTLVLALVMVLSLTACLSDCESGKHAFVDVEAKSATCTQAGNVAYKKCPVCGVCIDADGKQIAEADVVIPATGHVFDQEVATATYLATEATCTAKATYYYSCACGAKGTETFESGNLAAHAYTQEVATEGYLKSAATCTAKATYYYSCACGAQGTETFESGNLAAHAYTQEVATEGYLKSAATCQEKAVYYKSCECGAQGTETFESGNLAAHAYTQEVATEGYLKSAATCQEKAVYYKSCACGEKGTETFESGNLAAHTYGTWIDEVPATCVAAGTKGYYTCSVCEKNYDKDGNEITDLALDIDEDAHDCKYEDTSSTKHTVSCQREGCTYTAAVEHSYTNGVCVCGKTEPKVGWKGVNDVSELKVGDKIIIVGAKGDTLYAIGTNQKTNNREAVAITKNGAVITIGDNVQVIVLEEGTKEGTFAFRVGNGYLYAASSDSNYMKTETTLSDNSSWTITFDNGAATITAQGTSTRNLLQYNKNSSLFSCYGSDQTEVYIYKYYSACDHEGKATDTTTTAATCTTDGATVVTCKYCGEAISTTVLPAGHVYGEPVANATDSSAHTYTCTREGCEYSYNEAHAYENHVCTKCNAAEPTYTITVTNTAVDGNSATVVVKVGENVISIGADGNYTVYQNSEVTIIITAPEGYMFDVVKMDGAALESFSGSHSFTIAANVAFEVTIKLIPDTHTCDFTKATKLAETDENYATKHQMVCECTKVSEALVDHVFGEPVQIEGNATQHKLVCACGYEKEEAHDFDPDTHECVCGATDPNIVTTIANALVAESVGKTAIFTGTVVEIRDAWSTQYSNMSVLVSDGTDRILVYRTTTKVGIGDEVTVNGKIAVYSGANQIAAGDTITIDRAHICSTYTEADCTTASVCTVCGKEHSPALGHGTANADGKCPRCGEDLSKKSAEAKYVGATTNMKQNSNNASTIGLDSQIFNVTSKKISGSVQVGLNKDGYIRLYKNHSVELTIATIGEYEIVSIEIETKSGTVVVESDDTPVAADNGVYAINGSSVTIYNTSNSSVDIKSIRIVYRQVSTSEVGE